MTVWYLSTCTTCRRILDELGLTGDNAELIDIKTNPVTESQLEDMKEYTGSYNSLINVRSMQFRKMDKKPNELTEEEAKELLLSHYAFLKRPVIRIDEDYFVGNSSKTVFEVSKRL